MKLVYNQGMFTGIVEKQGRIRSVSGAKSLRLRVEKPASWKLKNGGSVAVDGICVTVIASTKDSFSCDLVPETLSRTTAKDFAVGRFVNLERPLKVGDELGGHFVLGHVDTRGKISDIKKKGASRECTISIPTRFARLVVEKGSVVVNGVSLTVARKRGGMFTVALIPYTLAHTDLGLLEKGGAVNIEFDSAQRYQGHLAARRKK